MFKCTNMQLMPDGVFLHMVMNSDRAVGTWLPSSMDMCHSKYQNYQNTNEILQNYQNYQNVKEIWQSCQNHQNAEKEIWQNYPNVKEIWQNYQVLNVGA